MLGRICFLVAAVAASHAFAESISIKEAPNDGRVYSTVSRVEVSGTMEFASQGNALSRPMKMAALHSYLERRVAGAGRDAEALRAIRFYSQSESSIEVDKDRTSLKLSEPRRNVVALGRREGVVCYSPSGPLTRNEMELLETPADSLAAVALLPRSNVEVGEKWTPDSWAVQMLASVDAVLKSDLTCEVESATADAAVVKFSGGVEGASEGASCNITLGGKYRYNRKSGHIELFELEQKEKRTIGAVTPGMNVTAKVTVERKLADSPEPLTDAVAEKVPLEPEIDVLMLSYEAPWGIRFLHDRDWHFFQVGSDEAVLRLLDKGTLVAQCNIRKIVMAEPGKHTSEETFQGDIRKSLGQSLQSIENAEQIKTDDGRFLYRVTAVGEVKRGEGDKARVSPMKWIYYLCAFPSGDQTAFLFSMDPALTEKLANRDLSIVKGLQFVKREPTKVP